MRRGDGGVSVCRFQIPCVCLPAFNFPRGAVDSAAPRRYTPPVPASTPELAVVLRQLRDHLRDAGYTPAALQRLLTVTYPDDIGPLNHTPALERLHDDHSAAAALIKLFFLEAGQPSRQVAAALPRANCEALCRAGMLQRRRDVFSARLRIDPVGDQYFLGDRRFRCVDRAALRLGGRDPVYPPSSDSLMLRAAVVPPRAAPAGALMLDLCTGSGVQALQQAAAVRSIVAVDINPRAVALARYNAQLNGVDRLDVRLGDGYAPVGAAQFDLITANPPFVASPYAQGPSYHAGGATGDRVLRRIIAGLGQHLRPGGRAFAVSHVTLRTGEALADIAAGWFRGFPGRALVAIVEVGSPVDLAAAQALFALDRGLAAYAAEVQRWLAYLRRQRAREVAAILVAAERGAGRGVEVVDAQPRLLPLPLTAPPARRIAEWLGEQPSM
jgi:methylase of polypeptide subunit release factors